MKRILIVIIVFAACKNTSPNNKEKNVYVITNDSLISTIVGKWGGETGKPVLKIEKDSIYYFNEKKSYYYLFHDKDMIVLYKEGPFMLGNIHTLNDTLFFEINHGNITKAFRIR